MHLYRRFNALINIFILNVALSAEVLMRERIRWKSLVTDCTAKYCTAKYCSWILFWVLVHRKQHRDIINYERSGYTLGLFLTSSYNLY